MLKRTADLELIKVSGSKRKQETRVSLRALMMMMMIVDVVKCVLMMIRRDTKEVRGDRVSLQRAPLAKGLQTCSCEDMCVCVCVCVRTAPVMAPS